MATKGELDEVLEQSLSQIAMGQAGVEDCLASNPGMAGELEVLLLAAQRLWAIPKPVLSPEAKAQMEARVLAAAVANSVPRPARHRRERFVFHRWRWALNVCVALVLMAVLMTTTLVTASAQALPGSAMYPVKLAAEDAWLRLTPMRERSRLHLRLAERRLAEIAELAARGRFEPSVIEAMEVHVDAALNDLEDLPPALALPVLAAAKALIEEQQHTLVELSADLPVGSRAFVEKELGETEAQYSRVGELYGKLRPHEPAASPRPTTSPMPVVTSVTAAVQPRTSAPKPTSPGDPDPSPAVESTRLPRPSRTLSPVPSATPEPAQTAKPTKTSKAPKSGEVQAPTRTPKPAKTPRSGGMAEPTEKPEPTEAPEPTEGPAPMETPEPTGIPRPREAPELKETVEPTEKPEPERVRPANAPRPSRAPKARNTMEGDRFQALVLGQGGPAINAAFTAWRWVSHRPEVLVEWAKSNQTLTALQRDFNKGAV